MKKDTEHKSQQLSDFLNFNSNLAEHEKQIQAAVMAGITEQLDTDQAFKKVMGKTGKRTKTKKLIQQITRVAAILAIPLLVYSSWSIYKQFSESQEKIQLAEQEFTSPVGMRSHVILPDGTKVWLNAESKIRYSVPFIREKREINIEGQAFLDVSLNKKSPFIVNAANTIIEVTGTSFDVKAYPEEEQVTVALQKGSVNLQTSNGVETKTTRMKAGDYFTVEKSTNTIHRQKLNVDKQIAWHKNVLVLDDTPLEEMAVLLGRWYGVKVFITDDELKQYKFNATFENEPLNRVLELLELSSPKLKFTYNPGKINKNPGEKNYSTVTISKK